MWNQWNTQPSTTSGFQAAGYPTTANPSATTAPTSGGFPMGYPFYPSAMQAPTGIPGYAGAQQWPMPQQQQQQWQQWEQWHQQYAQWQQQYGDKYQNQLMMGRNAGLPPLPDALVNPPLPGDAKDNSKNSNSQISTDFTQGGVQGSDGGAKRSRDISANDSNTQVSKKPREIIEELSEEEKIFDAQFKNWENQLLKWKEQNSSHPDKDQFKEYEAKWESIREQMRQKRELMRKKRETKLADENKVSSSSELSSSGQDQKIQTGGDTQKQTSSLNIATAPNITQNPIAMQGMGFPPYSNPPPIVPNPMVQQAMGFPNFTTPPFPTFPTQPPGYGITPPFHTQGMFPGINMMCPPPSLSNTTTGVSDLLNSSPLSQPPPTKKETTVKPGSQSDKLAEGSFLKKTEGGNKGIPGLDLAESGMSRETIDSHNLVPPKNFQTNPGPLHTSDDNTPFNFPPPSKTQAELDVARGYDNTPLNSQNFGPRFNSNIRGSFPRSFNQNLQKPSQFGLNSLQGPPPNFQKPLRPFLDQDNKSQRFGPQKPSIPNLMDGFDPAKGPPSFSSNKNDENQDDYGQEEDEYDEYDGSRFQNPWDNYDENNEENFVEQSKFGNKANSSSNFNKPGDGFGLSKNDSSYKNNFNRGIVGDRFGSQESRSDNYSKFSGNNAREFNEKSGNFFGTQGNNSSSSRGGYGRGSGSRFDNDQGTNRFGDSRFGPGRRDLPYNQDLDNVDQEGRSDQINDHGERFGRGNVLPQNRCLGSNENFDKKISSLGNKLKGPGERFEDTGDQFGNRGGNASRHGGFDGPSRGASGSFNNPQVNFGPGGRGSRGLPDERFGDENAGFGGSRFTNQDKPFRRVEDQRIPGPNSTGLLPHPNMGHDNQPSVKKAGLLPIPGRPADKPTDNLALGGKSDIGIISGAVPPFPHDVKKIWDDGPSKPKSEESTQIIDYDHKPLGGNSIYEDLNHPESLEPMQVYDYNHGENPGPYMPHTKREPFEEDDWRNNMDRGPRGSRGRDDRERFGPRGKWNWDEDRRGSKDRGDERRLLDERSRERERDWAPGKRDDRRDRERNDRERNDRERNDRERNDRERNDRERDRERYERDRDRDRFDRRDSRRDEKENSSKNVKDEKSSHDLKVQKPPAVLVEDILNNPGRINRPSKIVIILRGPPGSGKTFVAKLIKDKEVEMGGSAPRILSLDDYFMVEIEKEEKDPETGKTVKNKVMEYEYESGMESNYRHSLIKSFRKTIFDGYFPFIIIDCVHEKLQHYEEILTFSKQKGFQVYICEMDKDLSICTKRNIHKRSEKEIQEIIKNWEPTPQTQTILDVRSLLQSAAITEVDMEDTEDISDENEEDKKAEEVAKSTDDKTELEGDRALFTSKWDNMEYSGEKLDRLDGLAKARRPADTIKDWLQLPDDYYESSGSNVSKSGKRVRWADLEERRQQEKMRAIGFVVGQTDWSRMMDPSCGGDKLAQTKYI